MEKATRNRMFTLSDFMEMIQMSIATAAVWVLNISDQIITISQTADVLFKAIASFGLVIYIMVKVFKALDQFKWNREDRRNGDD